MQDERLLERLQTMERSPDSRTERSFPRLVDSIVNHLQRMLNTHQGSVPIAGDYGIPDITNVSGEGFLETTKRIENTLQRVIMKYEPRLTGIKMSLISDSADVLALRFKMEAVLMEDRSTPVVFETVVSSDGKVNVSE